jgi:type IV fimbrial biogenesis protein FimT
MKNKGFTLIELMVAVAIFAILVAVAAPSFRNMVISNSVNMDRDLLFSFLLSARAEAITQGIKVSVCKSSDLDECDATVAWTDGWIMFTDQNGDGAVSTGDTILKVNEALVGNVSLVFSGGNFVTFDSLGRPGANTGTFSFTHSSGDSTYDRSVSLSTTGRARKG